MKVYVMSGIPGSGKSTWIDNELKGRQRLAVSVCSADHYHYDDDGCYRYRPENAGKAHALCLGSYLRQIQGYAERRGAGVPLPDAVVVDNTNIRAWEASPYVRLAELFGFDYEIVRVYCDPVVAASRNVHQVPFERVMQMYRAFLADDFPGHWRVRGVPSWPAQ
jgi:hypothetical protein